VSPAASWYSTLSPAFSMAADHVRILHRLVESATERRSTIAFGVLAGA